MRILFLSLLVITTIWASTNTKNTQVQKSHLTQNDKEMALVESIKENYEAFIDTKPSSKKHDLALLTKEQIITFQATFPNSRLKPSLLILLRELSFYLNP